MHLIWSHCTQQRLSRCIKSDHMDWRIVKNLNCDACACAYCSKKLTLYNMHMLVFNIALMLILQNSQHWPAHSVTAFSFKALTSKNSRKKKLLLTFFLRLAHKHYIWLANKYRYSKNAPSTIRHSLFRMLSTTRMFQVTLYKFTLSPQNAPCQLLRSQGVWWRTFGSQRIQILHSQFVATLQLLLWTCLWKRQTCVAD